ncbi:hypothetical protein [Streptomyces sp. CBMA123]|nr:hypothetical protein [Streptomyces sp. CBMA123]
MARWRRPRPFAVGAPDGDRDGVVRRRGPISGTKVIEEIEKAFGVT